MHLRCAIEPSIHPLSLLWTSEQRLNHTLGATQVLPESYISQPQYNLMILTISDMEMQISPTVKWSTLDLVGRWGLGGYPRTFLSFSLTRDRRLTLTNIYCSLLYWAKSAKLSFVSQNLLLCMGSSYSWSRVLCLRAGRQKSSSGYYLLKALCFAAVLAHPYSPPGPPLALLDCSTGCLAEFQGSSLMLGSAAAD